MPIEMPRALVYLPGSFDFYGMEKRLLNLVADRSGLWRSKFERCRYRCAGINRGVIPLMRRSTGHFSGNCSTVAVRARR